MEKVKRHKKLGLWITLFVCTLLLIALLCFYLFGSYGMLSINPQIVFNKQIQQCSSLSLEEMHIVDILENNSCLYAGELSTADALIVGETEDTLAFARAYQTKAGLWKGFGWVREFEKNTYPVVCLVETTHSTSSEKVEENKYTYSFLLVLEEAIPEAATASFQLTGVDGTQYSASTVYTQNRTLLLCLEDLSWQEIHDGGPLSRLDLFCYSFVSSLDDYQAHLSFNPPVFPVTVQFYDESGQLLETQQTTVRQLLYDQATVDYRLRQTSMPAAPWPNFNPQLWKWFVELGEFFKHLGREIANCVGI